MKYLVIIHTNQLAEQANSRNEVMYVIIQVACEPRRICIFIITSGALNIIILLNPKNMEHIDLVKMV